MKSKRLLWIALSIIVTLVIVVVITAMLTPQQTPAFAAAIAFVEAAGRGDDAAAFALLDERLRAYVASTCPDGSVSACITAYTPPEWGDFLRVVFRRAAPEFTPEGTIWNVDLIATYAEGTGFSGVCIYTRMAEAGDDDWRVTRWAGFVSCGDPASRNMAANPEAPNSAP